MVIINFLAPLRLVAELFRFPYANFQQWKSQSPFVRAIYGPLFITDLLREPQHFLLNNGAKINVIRPFSNAGTWDT